MMQNASLSPAVDLSTSGYCDCEDKTLFRVTALEEKDCNSVKADAAKPCAIYGGVSDHCSKSTNGVICCQDDLSFRYKGRFDCSWAGRNPKRKKLSCAKNLMARNCPETRGLNTFIKLLCSVICCEMTF